MFDLGEWTEANTLAEDGVSIQPPGRAPRRYSLTRWVPLLVAQGDERAEQHLEELRVLLDGFSVETQFNGPYRVAAAEAALWRGDPDAALKSIQDGLRESETREWPRYHLRFFRMGMRAAAEVAEVARARRDATAERAAIQAGTELWESLQPVLTDSHARQRGPAADETAAEVATIEAERRRLHREPAAAAWLDAADRWQARENPYLRAYCRWREAESLLGEGDRAAAATALGEAHRIATTLGARPLTSRDQGPRREVPPGPVGGGLRDDRRRGRPPTPTRSA